MSYIAADMTPGVTPGVCEKREKRRELGRDREGGWAGTLWWNLTAVGWTLAFRIQGVGCRV